MTTKRLRTLKNLVPMSAPKYWTAFVPQGVGAPLGQVVPATAPKDTTTIGFPLLHSMVIVNHFDQFHCTKSDGDTQVLFMRQETVDYLTFLNSSTTRIVFVNGPSGAGKTSSLLLWIQHRLSLGNVVIGSKAVWFNVDTHTIIVITRTANGCTVGDFDVHIGESVDISAIFDTLLLYVVLDGCVRSNEKDLQIQVEHLHRNSTAKIFVTTSISFTFMDDPESETVYVEPWKHETYHLMVQDDDFFRTIKRNLVSVRAREALDDAQGTPLDWDTLLNSNIAWDQAMKTYVMKDKFEVAGHSCRWMFGVPYKRVIEQIRQRTDRVASIGDVLDGTIEELYDCLRCSFQSASDEGARVATFTSNYIARALLRLCDTRFLQMATQSCTRRDANPSLDEILLELDVLHCLKTGGLDYMIKFCSDYVYAHPVHRYNVPPDSVRTFKSASGWTGPTMEVDITSGTAFIPDVFNNGGFDCVVIRRTNDVVTAEFLQVIRAKRHGLRFYFMHNFITVFNATAIIPAADHITHAKVTIIGGKESVQQFQVPAQAQIIGSLQNFGGWTAAQLEIASFMRTS